MNNIIAVARDKEQILAPNTVARCSVCSERYYSPFDKLYVAAYGKGACCSTEEEFDELSENIFRILSMEG